MKKVILIMLFIILAAGCKSGSIITSDVFVRDTTYTAKPPVINDSGKTLPEYIIPFSDSAKIDTVFRYVKINPIGDTIVNIKYVPKTQWLYYTVQPDTVKIPVRDTLRNSVTLPAPVIETPLMSKIGIFSIGFLVAGLLIVALIIFYFARKKNATNTND